MSGDDGAGILTGGLGNDFLDGGKFGSDTASYSDATGAVTVNLLTGTATGAAGKDTLLDIENIFGSSYADTLTGDASSNQLDGGAGNDSLTGGAGFDTLRGDAGDDSLNGGDNDDWLDGGDGNDTLSGGAGDDTLLGFDGDDTLNGGIGADSMDGGSGNDSYVVDNVDDVITEFSFGGLDKVSSSVTYTLSADVENLTLSGASAINGTGNGKANVIIGNTANNQLDGKSGDDTLEGGKGTNSLRVVLVTISSNLLQMATLTRSLIIM